MPKILLALFVTTMMLSAGVSVSPVPEPSTYLMMGAGLGTLIYLRSKFGKKK